MGISYKKLFIRLKNNGMNKYTLRNQYGFSPTIINRLSKNQDVRVSTIIRLSEILDCQPGDIMEIDYSEQAQKGDDTNG